LQQLGAPGVARGIDIAVVVWCGSRALHVGIVGKVPVEILGIDAREAGACVVFVENIVYLCR
jgi:hypothetical protein